MVNHTILSSHETAHIYYVSLVLHQWEKNETTRKENKVPYERWFEIHKKQIFVNAG